MLIFNDSQAALAVIGNGLHRARNRFIGTNIKWLKEMARRYLSAVHQYGYDESKRDDEGTGEGKP